VNVVALSWKQPPGAGTPTWVASYRLEPATNGDGYEIARYTCDEFDPPARVRLTGDLLADQPCGPPNAGNSGYATAVMNGARVDRLRICVTAESENVTLPIRVDIASTNPAVISP
jgi:hypothetical protein